MIPCAAARGAAARCGLRLRRPSAPALATAALALAALASCTGQGKGDPVRVHIPAGSSFAQVTDSLAAHSIVRAPRLFRVYGRLAGADADVKPGTYEFRPATGWREVLEDLRAGRVMTVRVVIPEGWDIPRIAPRLGHLIGAEPDSVLAVLADTASATRFDVPGPNLEGYLYPATYTFPVDPPLDTVLAAMVRRYRSLWTPERRLRADSIGLEEREVVTLASIIEKEARARHEMPTMAAVYHNRLRIGMPLQADPTVQYALGTHQSRLLYAHIDSVADHPYNTYARRGLPPGPIGSVSAEGVDAVLHPDDVPFLYFVATPAGTHVFSRTLEEHNRARAALQRARQQAEEGG